MGWLKREKKPEEGQISWVDLPEEEQKLSGEKKRPVIITGNNQDDSSRGIACTTKQKPEKGDIKITTKPEQMDEPTYARLSEGERDIENTELKPDKFNRRVTDDIWEAIRKRL